MPHPVLRFISGIIVLFIVACSTDKSATISQEELLARLDKEGSPTIIDVRTPNEYAQGHIPGAINVPHREFENKLIQLKLKPGDEVVIYCESGGRAGVAEGILKSKGYFEVRHLDGDMGAWRQAKLPCIGC